MDTLIQAFQYALNPDHNFLGQLLTHVRLSGIALFVGASVGIPLGILISQYGSVERVVVNVVGFLQAMPPIVVLFLLLPSQGIGFRPSVIALTFLAIAPLLINTDTGMRGVDAAIVEAGRGMGMSYWQLLRRVQLPLAIPVIIAGLRIASVRVIGFATLATLIGGGGLGDFIADGLALLRNDIILVGAIPAALLTIGAGVLLDRLQRKLARDMGRSG
jgi:osmoprotectant transport system permease protein